MTDSAGKVKERPMTFTCQGCLVEATALYNGLCAACDEEAYFDAGEGRSCQSCGGEGFNWCDNQNDSEGCWERDCNGTSHTCFNCRGSGAAMDQWFW